MFMLAEASQLDLHQQAFDMTYGWDTLELFKNVAKGKAGAYRMRFTSNHDVNSWHGHDGELYGPAHRAMAVLSATLPGMPLIYGGQESRLGKRLEFFEKDPVQWNKYEEAPFYARLLKLKHDNRALWNGQYGGAVQLQETGNDKVFAFRREKDGTVVSVAVNVSGTGQGYTLPGNKARRSLAAWDYRIDAPRK